MTAQKNQKNKIVERRYFREKELEALSGIPSRTLQNLRLRGKGPSYFKLGTARKASVLYDLAEFQAWLESFRVGEAVPIG